MLYYLNPVLGGTAMNGVHFHSTTFPSYQGDNRLEPEKPKKHNQMKDHNGLKLTPSIAKQLIKEIFAGQTVQLQEIKKKVEEVHAKRDGQPSSAQYSPVSRALRQLKESGHAENPQHGFWSINLNEDSSNEDKPIQTLEDYLEWANGFKEDEFVFRGVPNETFKIQASAFRRPDKSERNFEKFLHINKDLISAARQRGYDKKDGTELSVLDILAELQHHGAATCLIDFTYSAQIALWFACQPDTKTQKESKTPNNGKVYGVRIKSTRFREITPDFLEKDAEQKRKISYFLNDGDDSQLSYWQPKYQNYRIIAQQSVFLLGQHQFEPDCECVIAEDSKVGILKELHRISGITEDKLFPDFEGFAAKVHSEDATYTDLTPTALKDRGIRVYERATENKHYDGAIEDFSRAIEKAPDDVNAYNLRARAYTRQKRYQLAFKDYEKAIELNPDYAETYLNRGTTYYDKKDYDYAIENFDKAIEKKSEYGDAYYRRGYTYYTLSQHDAAVNDFTDAIQFMPNSPYAYYYRGLAKYHSDSEEDAITDFAEAIRLKSDYVKAYYYSGLTKYELMLYEPSIRDFDKVIELDPSNVEALLYRAEVKVAQRRFLEAKQDLDRALELAHEQNDDGMRNQINILLNEIETRTDGGSQNEE